jgi:hypothetical protein
MRHFHHPPRHAIASDPGAAGLNASNPIRQLHTLFTPTFTPFFFYFIEGVKV